MLRMKKLRARKALQKERQKKIENIDYRLAGEDRERVDNIILYIVSKSLGIENECNVIIDVIDVINEGLDRGLSLDQILGDDDKNFVDEIASSYKKSYTYLIGVAGGTLAMFTLAVMVFQLPHIVRSHRLAIDIYGGVFFECLIVVIIAIFLVEYIVKTTYEKLKVSKWILPVASVTGCVVLAVLTWNTLWFTVPLWGAALVILAGYLIYDFFG